MSDAPLAEIVSAGEVPGPCAHLVFESGQGTKNQIKIYRWYGNSASRVLASSQAVKE